MFANKKFFRPMTKYFTIRSQALLSMSISPLDKNRFSFSSCVLKYFAAL
ncbi:hypothetical protein EVA_18191 [gut metagenome]|uniref:Uncharacterized protein n=1 Tax=gut metagenome TaxID=749906 RepID=J9FVV6_9ZZZZ